ncbi:hypothetical protein C6Y14_07565 [Streptomyces dioscori]|uniref:Uncharacterized protein n=1 Tax=Streptomyces dioscori TaxID=2109333 RepID=A0A2P8QD83_9ACTN|nr:hypothetical protein C6Y14_07565 [Streptomyces dioscori]
MSVTRRSALVVLLAVLAALAVLVLFVLLVLLSVLMFLMFVMGGTVMRSRGAVRTACGEGCARGVPPGGVGAGARRV